MPPFSFYLPFVLAGQAFLFSLMRKESKRIKKNLGHPPATADPMRWFFAQRALLNKHDILRIGFQALILAILFAIANNPASISTLDFPLSRNLLNCLL
jgi:hypothetical protein